MIPGRVYSVSQWVFIFLFPLPLLFLFCSFFCLFLLCLTVDQTGNACLIGKISEASASCRRKMRRLKNVKRYTPLLCVSFLIVKEMEKMLWLGNLFSKLQWKQQ